MAKIEFEGMQELIDKVNKLGLKGEVIKKKTLDKAGTLLKPAWRKKHQGLKYLKNIWLII